MISFRALKGTARALTQRCNASRRIGQTNRPLAVSMSSLVASQSHLAMLPSKPGFKPSKVMSRLLSSTADRKIQPSYVVYGEECALTIKAIPPQFRKYGANSFVLDSRNKGRILLEWTPRMNNDSSRYNWDAHIRFALSAEEAGLLISRMSSGDELELVRKMAPGGDGRFNEVTASPIEKVFNAVPAPDGSIHLHIDFMAGGEGSQHPPSSSEAHGPLSIALTGGEYQVIKSIIEYSLPRLVGWCAALDSSIERSLSEANATSRDGYPDRGAPRDGGVPF